MIVTNQIKNGGSLYELQNLVEIHVSYKDSLGNGKKK